MSLTNLFRGGFKFLSAVSGRQDAGRHQGLSRSAAARITRLSSWGVAILLCCIAPATLAAQTPALRALDFYPADVSADGSVVTGKSDQGRGATVVWTSATGTQTIGLLPPFEANTAHSVSADGSVVVGGANHGFCHSCTLYPYDPVAAFRWTAATGTIGLGTQVGGQEMYTANTVATDVSADGSVAVGNSVSSSWWLDNRVPVSFRWTADTGMALLPDMHLAYAVSDDGTTVVGAWDATPGIHTCCLDNEATHWTAEEGTIRIGVLPGHSSGEATDVSADGSVVVGVSHRFYDGNIESHLFRWTAAGGMTDLGLITKNNFGHSADVVATSADGSIIVGDWIFQTGLEPFIWDEPHGMRPLGDVLTGLGVDLGGWDLEKVDGISDDGRTFIGYGRDRSGNYSGWVVTVPELLTLTGDYNGSGTVEQADLDLVLLNWGVELAGPAVTGWINDLPRGLIDQEDLDRVLLNWGHSDASGIGSVGAVPEPGSVALLTIAAAALFGRRLWGRGHNFAAQRAPSSECVGPTEPTSDRRGDLVADVVLIRAAAFSYAGDLTSVAHSKETSIFRAPAERRFPLGITGVE